MRPELRYLQDKDLEYVHNTALELLENMGIELAAEEARDYFEKAGATVEGDIVKIPRKI
ncbi:MAG: trimethylamine methyltransferase family protein, partial [Eubacterium sp.]